MRAVGPAGEPLAFRPMADVRPIQRDSLRPRRGRLAGRRRGAALRRDRREQRAELLERSPYNAVAIDLPKPYGETGPQQTEGDPYERAARDDGRLARGRRPGRRRRAGDLGDDPGLHRPRRQPPHPPRHPRPGPGRGLRRRPGAAARAHPAGPEEGPARPDPRHPAQPLADLLAQHRGPLAAGRAGDRAAGALGRGDRRRRHGDPGLAGRRPGGPRRGHRAARRRRAADRRRPPPLRDRDRLPRRGRRRGRPRLHPDGADRPRRPRPHRLPHPPPALRLRRRPRAPAPPRRGPARAVRRRREVALERARPARRGGRRRLRPLRLPPQAGLPPAAEGQAVAELDEQLDRQARGLPPPRRGDPRDAGARRGSPG